MVAGRFLKTLKMPKVLTLQKEETSAVCWRILPGVIISAPPLRLLITATSSELLIKLII